MWSGQGRPIVSLPASCEERNATEAKVTQTRRMRPMDDLNVKRFSGMGKSGWSDLANAVKQVKTWEALIPECLAYGNIQNADRGHYWIAVFNKRIDLILSGEPEIQESKVLVEEMRNFF